MHSIQRLFTQYKPDIAHAEYVALLASQLFTGTHSLHQLSDRAHYLLYAAALLHDIAAYQDRDTHHILGRDLVMQSELPEFNKIERQMVACMVAFHRNKRFKPLKEPLFVLLNASEQRQTVILSGLLRVADGLDRSHTQSTQIHQITPKSDEVWMILTTGATCKKDSEQANEKTLSDYTPLPILWAVPMHKHVPSPQLDFA
ncbi:MAG: HD domain-containing protein [Anaerolineae bacterium]|nr:HD domain-containing protein [Anaerolineae bacterium]